MGTSDDPERLAANLCAMEALALPLVALVGSTHVGDAPFTEIFHQIAERLLLPCDAVLWVGGASQGADEMLRPAAAIGKQIFLRWTPCLAVAPRRPRRKP